MAVTLRLRAKGDLLCADYDAHESGIKRFVGRKHSIEHGVEYRDEQGNLLKTGGWPSTGEPQELPYRAELVQAVREGDCWAADEATATACGVTFDPTCGGEVKPAAPTIKRNGPGDISVTFPKSDHADIKDDPSAH